MNLTSTKFSQYVLLDRPLLHSRQVVVKFPNNFGASIIRGDYTYGGSKGLYEIGVIIFDKSGEDFSLTYTTSITDDVLGYLTEEEVLNTLEKIFALKETRP